MPKLSQKYHKIMSVYKRDGITKKFIIGEWSTPEIKFLKDNKWIFTEKVDGTNIRVMFDGKECIYGGRSNESQIPTNLIYRLDEIFKTFGQRQKLKEIFPEEENLDIVFYGEGCGKKIQKGGENYKKDGVDFVLFDIWVNGFYLERDNIDNIAQKLGIKSVPIIGMGTLEEAINMTKSGFKSQWGDFIAEGIVARPEIELFTRKSDRIITKVKYRDFI